MPRITTKENCEDYEYFKQKKDKDSSDFIRKGYRKVWPEDEDLNKKLKCIDESHSKSKCISEESLSKLEKDLIDYAKSKGDPICAGTRKAVLTCLSHKQIFDCDEEIDEFKACVSIAAQNINKPKPNIPNI